MARVPALLRADGPPALILVRFAVGAVFLGEGIQKFLFPDQLAVGRFTTIGIPAPGFFGPFDGAVEAVCGLLLLVGLLTRLAAVPLLVDMALAIALTKIPILWGGSADKPKLRGFWDLAHEARADRAMLFVLLFLLIVGPGRWSLDALLAQRAAGDGPTQPERVQGTAAPA